jgi:predicted Zn-dependent protease
MLWKRKAGVRAQFERVAERVEKAAADVCREMGLPQKNRKCYYYIELSTSPQLNAAADGKKVTIYMGMMHFIANDDELAAVIGHELTHNLMDHRGAKMTNGLLAMAGGALLEAAAATQGINSRGEITQSAMDFGTLAYSSEFEREADYVGLYIAARAGYNIRNAMNYWRRLSVQEPDSENGGLTHPSNPERFIAMQKTIEEIEFKRKQHLALLPDVKPEL